ncbi:MAG: DUF58 domain-containing protein [Planctomycetaceae bacterium]
MKGEMTGGSKQPVRALVPISERTVSVGGIVAMVAGLGVIVTELRTGFMMERLDMMGRVVIFVCGGFFSVWGLKEIVSGLVPSLNQGRLKRHRFALPVEGQMFVLIMFVMFVGALVGRSNPLVLIFSLMAGPFVVNGWLTFMMLQKLDVSRSHPERVMAGDPLLIEVTLKNRKRYLPTWLVTVVDRVANSREVLHPKVQFSVVPARAEESGHYRIELNQRGPYHFGSILINTRFPLGLVERGVQIEGPGKVLVYPRILRMQRHWLSRLLSTSNVASSALPRGGAHDDDFRKLREYRPGDDPRAIHWATSARQSELMVREYQENRDADCVVLLDAWVPDQVTDDDSEQVEMAISLATSIWFDRLRQSGDSAPVFAANSEPRLVCGTDQSAHHTEPLLDELALLVPNPSADVATLLDVAATHATGNQSLVLVTPRPAAVQEAIALWSQQPGGERARIASQLLVIESNAATLDSMMF